MSWSSRFASNFGRFSPFTRSPPTGSGKVNDADFSYITADDLRKHQAESLNTQQDSREDDLGPARDTDVVRVHSKGRDHAIHFAAYSIAKGQLTVGQLREQTAKKVGAGDFRQVKLSYHGRGLKDDNKTCKQEGLRHDAELNCTISDNESDEEDDDDEFAASADNDGTGEPKKRRNRGKKTKRRNKREERDGVPSSSAPPPEHLGVPPSHTPLRNESPKPSATPTTPLEKLEALHQKLQEFVPLVDAFVRSPPAEPAKKEFENKKLEETIFTQVQLKIDAVETEGDPEARARRKELVKETQKVLQTLDAAK